MKIRILKYGVATLLIVGSLFIFGCSLNNKTDLDNQSGGNVVNIGSFSRAIDYAPYIIAKNKGWFEDVAIKYDMQVNYIEFQSLPAINEALATNNLDVVFQAEPPAIIGRSAGIGVSVVAPGVTLVQEIVVPVESDINVVTDLIGKKVAVPSGSSSHYALNKILLSSGLKKDDVEIIDMSPQDGKAAFTVRQVDAWAIWPPFVEQEEYAGTGRVLTGGDVFIQSIVAMRDGFVTNNSKLSLEIIDVIERSQMWIESNAEEAQMIVAEELGIDLEVVKLAWNKHNFNPTFLEEELNDIQDKADFLYSIGLIKNNIDVSTDLVNILK